MIKANSRVAKPRKIARHWHEQTTSFKKTLGRDARFERLKAAM